MLPLGWESLVGCIYLVGSLVALSVAFVGCENEYYFTLPVICILIINNGPEP